MHAERGLLRPGEEGTSSNWSITNVRRGESCKGKYDREERGTGAGGGKKRRGGTTV